MRARLVPTLVALALGTLAVGGTTLGASADVAPGASTPSYDAGPITIDPDAPQGAAPGIVWADGTTIHLEDGTSFVLPDDGFDTVIDVAAIGDRVAVTRHDSTVAAWAPRLSIFDRSGTQLGWTGLGRASDGNLVADDAHEKVAVLQRGQVAVIEAGRPTWTRLDLPAADPVGDTRRIGAVTGTSCAEGDCRVYVSNGDVSHRLSPGQAPRWMWTPQILVDARETAGNDQLLGLLDRDEEVDPELLFWGITDEDNALAWGQQDYGVLSFSPDGSLVLGDDAYRDGAGSGRLAFLDSATGEPVTAFEPAEGWWVAGTAWEDDDHVLAQLTDAADTLVTVRVGTDGSVEHVHTGSWEVILGS
ncbi:hypothetical protein QE364_000800 [Nocardioides zeae]|uniref:Uncharacterized protein n=1 Tax=Nocardioides zeae TaxID=1457234 RepID=A0ACC6IEP2_9ACTN|nr:hypothetical protein [Nocardioides zeae]MDR6174303.1 hypothetical protein [Nocardioides zeae]MDR6209108.1 hypothetical protein [Nocardioides zeae]